MDMRNRCMSIHTGAGPRHLLTTQDQPPAFLEAVLDAAARVKARPARYARALAGRKLYMLFQKTSTRTALSFAAGMHELGGFHFSQAWEDSNFAVGEPEDEVRYVAR